MCYVQSHLACMHSEGYGTCPVSVCEFVFLLPCVWPPRTIRQPKSNTVLHRKDFKMVIFVKVLLSTLWWKKKQYAIELPHFDRLLHTVKASELTEKSNRE